MLALTRRSSRRSSCSAKQSHSPSWNIRSRAFLHIQAEVAYAESVAAVEYLNGRYGMSEIVRTLESIGSGVEPETALRNSTGMDYSVLGQRIGESLARGR